MSLSRIQKGQWAENFVKDYLQKNNFICLATNLKTPWAQIDLLMKKPDGKWLILEVKYLSDFVDPLTRLNQPQKQRLRRAQRGLSARYNQIVGLGLAFVRPNQKIEFIDLDEF